MFLWACIRQVVDLIREYNSMGRNSIAIMLDTKGPEVRSGDLSAPIDLVPGMRAQRMCCELRLLLLGLPRNLGKATKESSGMQF